MGFTVSVVAEYAADDSPIRMTSAARARDTKAVHLPGFITFLLLLRNVNGDRTPTEFIDAG
jgi:hypothetical protein